MRKGFVNLDSVRQSRIEVYGPNEEYHSQIGKDDEEDQFYKAVTGPIRET